MGNGHGPGVHYAYQRDKDQRAANQTEFLKACFTLFQKFFYFIILFRIKVIQRKPRKDWKF
jgi:hypothetical protein